MVTMDHLDLANLRGLLLDLDGVVYRGMDPLPGAAELSATLRSLGIRYAFVTNNATLTPRQYQVKLGRMGVHVKAHEVLTSPQATAAYLKAGAPPGTAVYVIGEHGLRQALRSAGFDVGGPDPKYVVVGLDRHLTYKRLAEASLAIRRGAALVATNADPAIPVEAGMWPGAGAILAAVEKATATEAVVIGKPQPTLVRIALERIGTDPERTAMVGDQVGTDIRAGEAAGLKTILVDGALAPVTAEPRPDLVVRDLADLWSQIKKARGYAP
jgi:4-nitrophenyl phosphatase